jgi:hypothetical protein
MSQTKKCIKCKEILPINSFYKNKLILDGHSNYCVDCTKVSSKKYWERKKEKIQNMESDNLMKLVLLTNIDSSIESSKMDSVMKIMMIEKMCRGILQELDNLKKSIINTSEKIQG